MDRVTISIGLAAWVVVMTFANGIDVNTLIALVLALPVIGFAYYLIWFDSRKPRSKQFRYSNSRLGKH